MAQQLRVYPGEEVPVPAGSLLSLNSEYRRPDEWGTILQYRGPIEWVQFEYLQRYRGPVEWGIT